MQLDRFGRITEPNGYGYLNKGIIVDHLKKRDYLSYVDIAKSVMGEDYLIRQFKKGFESFDPTKSDQPEIDLSFGYIYQSLHIFFIKLRREQQFRIRSTQGFGFCKDELQKENLIKSIEDQVTILFPKDGSNENAPWQQIDKWTKAVFFKINFFERKNSLQMIAVKGSDGIFSCKVIDAYPQKEAIETFLTFGYTDKVVATGNKYATRYTERRGVDAEILDKKLSIEGIAMNLRDVDSTSPGVVKRGEIYNRITYILRYLQKIKQDPDNEIEFEKFVINNEISAYLLDTRRLNDPPFEINGMSPNLFIILRMGIDITVEITDAQAQLVRDWPEGTLEWDTSSMDKKDKARRRQSLYGISKKIKKYGRKIEKGSGKTKGVKNDTSNMKFIFPIPSP